MIDLENEFRRIQSMDANETFNRAFDSLEAIRDFLAGGGSGSPGLCYRGTVTNVPGADQFDIGAFIGVGFGDTYFRDYIAYVVRDAAGLGAAPQGEYVPITVYVDATAAFTHQASILTAAIGVGDDILLIHPVLLRAAGILGLGTFDTDSQTVPADSTRAALYAWENNDYFKGHLLMPLTGDCRYQPRPISAYVAATGVFTLDEPFSQLPGTVPYLILTAGYPYQRLTDIINLVNAILVTTETEGTITTTGGVQDVYINNAPAGVYEPKIVKIDLTALAVAETVQVRTYYRYRTAGGWIMEDDVTYAGVQAEPSKPVRLDPNRWGIWVTLQRLAGAPRNHDWYVVYRS